MPKTPKPKPLGRVMYANNALTEFVDEPGLVRLAGDGRIISLDKEVLVIDDWSEAGQAAFRNLLEYHIMMGKILGEDDKETARAFILSLAQPPGESPITAASKRGRRK